MRYSRLPPLLAVTLMLASCGTTQAPPRSLSTLPPPSTKTPKATTATDPLCAELSHIELSRMDTDGTKKQVIKYNEKYDAACRP